MKILHTSDWHLGRSLYGRKRYKEFEGFLDWLAGYIESESMDALLIAGDVFDTGTPSNRAQELYYGFLCRIAQSSCRHVVITAGNHDSPTFLQAPGALLRFLNIHVITEPGPDPADEVIVLDDQNGNPGLIVCAVPYLRDKDIRQSQAGESVEDKAAKLAQGIREHYHQVHQAAIEERESIDPKVPIVAMGHLFTAGGKTNKDDGVRDLYVGSLAYVGTDAFPQDIDYLALGHLHMPQKVGSMDNRRYSGSPLPMSFGEANQQKIFLRVEFNGQSPEIKKVSVPTFQSLRSIKGTLEELQELIDQLKNDHPDSWLDVEYTGKALVGSLQEALDSMVQNSGLDIVRVRDLSKVQKALERENSTETLDELTEEEVFTRCLEARDVPDSQRDELTGAFREIMASLHEQDELAE